jgi:DnaK suppressor protein
MKKTDLKKFRELLEQRKQNIISQAVSVKEPVYSFKEEELFDEVDLASTESDQNMRIRLRDRERTLLKKINKAIKKIEDGEYGVCEECGEDIGMKRLEARPVTDLCIRCKEEQERVERSFADEPH